MSKVYTTVADIGNATLEAILYNETTYNKEIDMLHTIKPISLTEYDNANKRVNADMRDYYVIGKQAYVTGSSAARSSGDQIRLQGAERYSRDYYGSIAMILITQLLPRPERGTRVNADVKFVGSFPPIDVDYAVDLEKSVLGKWRVHWRGVDYYINVIDAISIDEPLAGLYNTILTKRGDYAVSAKRILEGVTLVLDGGGYTYDAIVIDENARVDYQSAYSLRDVAAHRTIEGFMRDVQAQYARILKGSILTMAQVTEALRTNTLDLRGLGKHDVGVLAQERRNELFNITKQLLNQYGGSAQYDTLYMTGGVSGLIQQEILSNIKHNNIVFADDIHSIHYANARGLMRFAQFGMKEGVF